MNDKELKKEFITIELVRGAEGFCLLILDKSGSGYRVAGPKAWGNPLNKPTATFKVEVNELLMAINQNKYTEN